MITEEGRRFLYYSLIGAIISAIIGGAVNKYGFSDEEELRDKIDNLQYENNDLKTNINKKDLTNLNTEFKLNGTKSYIYIEQNEELKNGKENISNNFLKEISILKEDKEILNQSLINLTNESYKKEDILNNLLEEINILKEDKETLNQSLINLTNENYYNTNNYILKNSYFQKIEELRKKDSFSIHLHSSSYGFYINDDEAMLLPFDLINDLFQELKSRFSRNKTFIKGVDYMSIEINISISEMTFTQYENSTYINNNKIPLNFFKISFSDWDWYNEILFDYENFCKDVKNKLSYFFKESENFWYKCEKEKSSYYNGIFWLRE